MKKLYFSLFTLLSGLLAVNAQTITATSHAPVVGDSYSRIQVDSTGANSLSSITGASAVWTFTTANSRTVSVVNSYTTGSSVSTGSMYPAGTIAKLGGAEKAFYKTSATDLKFWGGNVVIQGNTADFVFSTGVTQATYPMLLNDFTNTSSFTGTVTSSFGSGTISNGTATVIYDGSGTLSLPGRTFTNVVRIKTRTYFDFSLLVTGTVTFENYDYYDLSKSKHPLLTVAASTITSSFGPPSAQYYAYLNKDYMIVGVNELSKEVAGLNVFPNPAKSNFNIRLINENAEEVSYEITNTLGQTVRAENLVSSKGESVYSVETSNLEAGIYFVKVKVGNALSVKKITLQ